MKTIVTTILAAGLIFMGTFPGRGQERLLRGKVTVFDSIPLSNARVKVKSTKQVVFTDSVGLFSVQIGNTDKLLVQARGFYKQSVKIEEPVKYALVNLTIIPGEKNLDIAIGYGHVKDRDRLFAVSSLHNKNFDFSTYRDIYDAIVGRFPGVTVRGKEILIRGSKTFTGSEAALLVVDGMIVDENTFGAISPNDVENINVLKDGSSAIYGSRGANGVVIVETKRGK